MSEREHADVDRDESGHDDEHSAYRRTVLKATGVAAAATPLLGEIGTAAAQADDGRDLEALVDELTLAEKVLRTHGSSGGPEGIAGYVRGIESRDVPGIAMADGPTGASLGEPTTAFPHPIAAAATFDPDLIREQGSAIAREAKSGNVQMLLGPSMDTFRVPLHARNAETFGEDPFLAAQMATAYTSGVQSEGVIATPKHYACYNQASSTGEVPDYFSISEHNVVVDERPLRELYLRPFEAAVTDGNAGAVMAAYNRVNGIFASEHDDLLDDILKDDWGFDGLVVSDWGGTHSTVHAAVNGLDIEMPSGNHFGGALADAVKSDDVDEETVVDDMVRRGLWAQRQTGALTGDQHGSEPARGTDDHYATARQVAEDGVVLLKNDDVLPLDATEIDELALVGPDPSSFKPSVGGSDHIDAIRRVSPVDGLEAVGDDVTVTTVSTDQSTLVGPDAFAPESGDGSGLTAEYYPNADWSGSPARSRTETHVELTEDDLSGLDAETVSVRWTGTVTAPEAGTYAFSLTSQGRSRLYVDGEAVVTNEGGGFFGPKTEEYALELEAGQSYDVRVEAAGTPPVSLEWTPPEAVQAAADAAASADVAVVLAKTDTFYGDDRHEFALPGNQNAVVDAVASENETTVVALNAESPVAMPWLESVPGLLHVWFPGQEGGRALADVLFGETNPSGKSPVTFAADLEDYLPQAIDTLPNDARGYPGVDGTAYYDEGVFVGYRHFDEHDVDPVFPFGHGESYTSFEYENASVSRDVTTPGDGVTVSVDVTNTGDRDGAEAVQFYVGAVDAAVERPPKELAGVAKAEIPTGETETLSADVGREAFRYWDSDSDAWTVEDGEFDVFVAASSRDVRATKRIRVQETVDTEPTTSTTDAQTTQTTAPSTDTPTESGSTDGSVPGFTVLAAAAAIAAGAAQRLRRD